MADILIGLGGTGGKILKAFRQRLWTEYNDAQRKHFPIGFIYVDTDSSMIDPNDVSYQTIHGNCCFEPNDFVDIKTQSNIDAIFNNPQGYKRLLGVLGNVGETQAAVCPVGAAADQKRRAGRILFGSNVDAYLFKLGSVVDEVKKKEVGGVINIHIFAGLAGGTGSGSIIDAVAQTRKWLFERNYQENVGFQITVFCQLPENSPKANWDTGRYKANGYGALLELNNLFTSHFNQQWGTKTSKPCYDVTSSVDFGRLYLSYDNPTTENVREGRIPQELKIAGGLILYSNKNDFGHTVTEPEELAGLVADFVYARIFLPKNHLQQEFKRFYTFENVSNFRDEYDETADAELGTPLPVRTRTIGSFGIKRVVVPETDLQEHIAYTLGVRSLMQLKYNNWSNTAGYRDEPGNFDPISYINADGRRASWLMSADHLLLKKYILESDTREGWPEGEFNIYWDSCVDAWANVAKGAEHPFEKLIELCRGGYAEGFRGKGVEPFFSDKARSITTAYAKQISETVEKYFFKEWSGGRLPLNDASMSVNLLSKEIRDTAVKIAEQVIPNLEAKCKEYELTINNLVEEYLHTGMIKRALIFNNRFERAIHFAKMLYRAKTELVATRLFSLPLAQALEGKFSDIERRIIGFDQCVDNLIKFAKDRMVMLSDMHSTNGEEERDGTEDMTLPIIKFYSRNKMVQLEEKLICDKEKMSDINGAVRNSIVDALKSDGRFSNIQKLDRKVISSAFLGTVYEYIKSFHNTICVESRDKVLGMPILERLAHKYSGNEQALGQFATQVITASGVFTEINMNEVQLNNANTQPPAIGKNILFKRILVSLPKTEDPDLLEFAEKLKQKLEKAIPGSASSASVEVSTEGNSNNEITVVVLVNGYPMRAISSLSMLRAEYDRLIAQDPNNRIVLLSEGKDGDYKSLFARPPKTPDEIREDTMPYMILCLGLNKVMLDTQKTGEYGPGEKDFFGKVTITPWGYQKFTDMSYDDRLMNDKYRQLVKLYTEAMEEEFAEVDCSVASLVQAKKKEIEDRVMASIGEIIQTENPTPRSKYNDFVRWTQNAIVMLKSYSKEG